MFKHIICINIASFKTTARAMGSVVFGYHRTQNTAEPFGTLAEVLFRKSWSIEIQIKAQAAETLASMGLTVSDAVRVFLTRVVADKELPFALKSPSATSRVALSEANEIIKAVVPASKPLTLF